MNNFEKTVYEAVQAAFGKVLARYNLPAKEQIMRDAGKEILEYLYSHGFQVETHDHQQAVTDQLTGLRSRTSLMEEGTRAFHLARRYYLPLSVLMLAIDSFIIVNDTYGHLTGDAALCRVAEVCRKSVRQMDITAYIGGDEFVIVLPNTALAGALDLAERLRKKIECLKIQADNGSYFNLTVTIGVAAIEDASTDFEQMLICADSALYQAKNSGGNRVLAAS